LNGWKRIKYQELDKIYQDDSGNDYDADDDRGSDSDDSDSGGFDNEGKLKQFSDKSELNSYYVGKKIFILYIYALPAEFRIHLVWYVISSLFFYYIVC